LVSSFPITLRHPNKKLVYSIACPPKAKHGGTLIFTRYRDIPLPSKSNLASKVTTKKAFYDYKKMGETESTLEWHVNFADTHLFVAYQGPLFAQDEMQGAQ